MTINYGADTFRPETDYESPSPDYCQLKTTGGINKSSARMKKKI